MNAWTTKRDEFASFLLMRELDPAGIRQRIRQARKVIGLTQQDLADLLQVHKRTIENYENVRVPPWDEINPLAAALGINVGWLLHGESATEPAEPTSAQLAALEVHLEQVATAVDRLTQGEAEILAAIESARSQVLALLDPPPARPKRRRA